MLHGKDVARKKKIRAASGNYRSISHVWLMRATYPSKLRRVAIVIVAHAFFFAGGTMRA